MPANTDSPKLDPRFRALEALPGRAPLEPPPLSSADEEKRRQDVFRAIVLLTPGAQRAGRGGANAVDLLDDTFIAEGELSMLRALAMSPDVVYIEAPRPAVVELVDSVAATKATSNWPPNGNLTGQGVIVGIVDDGFDFALDDFRYTPGGNTRILYLWDQDQRVEYTRSDIEMQLTGRAR